MTYRVEFAPEAEREFHALDGPVRARIARALAKLAVSPRDAASVKALKGGNYRLRIGDWRVVYALHDDILLVLVLRIGHRREVYR